VPTPLPTILGSGPPFYPFKISYICNTSKSDGQAATPARSVKSPPIVKFNLPYNPVTKAQKNTLKAAVLSALGAFATDREITLGSTVYDNLSFDDDTFAGQENSSGLYSVEWSLTQIVPDNWSPGSSGAAFPLLLSNAISGLPFTQKQWYQTLTNKLPGGPKYTLSEFGGGWTGFPAGPLMAWALAFDVITTSEVTAILNHFLANWGDCFPFTYKDEDGTVYSNVYYAGPTLTIQWNDPNHASLRVGLVQMN